MRVLFLQCCLWGCWTALATQVSFQTTTSGNDDFLFSVIEKDEGGYLSLGYSTQFGAGNFDFYLVSVDQDGDILWSKTYGGGNVDLGYSIQPAADGGYFLVGTTQSYGQGGADFLLIKVDTEGETIWSKTYGGSGFDEAYEGTITTDGGLLMVGRTNSYGSGQGDMYAVKVDQDGVVQWHRTYGGTANEDAQQVQATTDGGYILVGHTQSFGAGNADVYLVKVDATGQVQWTKTYGGPRFDFGNTVQATKDGGYILAGQTNSFGYEAGEILLLKLNQQGELTWTRSYGGSGTDYCYYVRQNATGSFVLTGITNSFGSGNFDALIIHTDTTGQPNWSMAYGGPADEFSNAIVPESPQGGYLMVGNTLSFGNNSRGYLVKTDQLGNSSCNEVVVSMQVGMPSVSSGAGGNVGGGMSTENVALEVSTLNGNGNLLCRPSNIVAEALSLAHLVYPNPFTDFTALTLPDRIFGHFTLRLYDVNGKLVHQQGGNGIRELTISRAGLSQGIYFYQGTLDGQTVLSGKLIVQ